MSDSPAPRDRIAAIDSRSPERIAWANYSHAVSARVTAPSPRDFFMGGFAAGRASVPVLAAEPTTADDDLLTEIRQHVSDEYASMRPSSEWGLAKLKMRQFGEWLDALKRRRPLLAALAPEPAGVATHNTVSRDERDAELAKIIRSVMRQSDLPEHQLEKLQAVQIMLAPQRTEAMTSVAKTAAEVDRLAQREGITYSEALALLVPTSKETSE